MQRYFLADFYTTDDAVERTGDMTEEKQFLIQKSAFLDLVCELCYPVLIVLEAWAVYRYLQNPGKLFSRFHAAFFLIFLWFGSLCPGSFHMYGFSGGFIRLPLLFKKGEPLPKMDLRRKVNFKSALFYLTAS